MDTLATVSLNGDPVLECGNQFRRYSVRVDGLLRGQDSNELEVSIRSPFLEAEALALQLFDAPSHVTLRAFRTFRTVGSFRNDLTGGPRPDGPSGDASIVRRMSSPRVRGSRP